MYINGIHFNLIILNPSAVTMSPPILTLIKMGSLKNDLGNFNCLFLKRCEVTIFFLKSLCQLQGF